jgi:hypothetical protein
VEGVGLDYGSQELAPGWLDREALAEEQKIGLHRFGGIVGGLIAGLWGFNWLVHLSDYDTGADSGGRWALPGVGLVILAAYPYDAEPETGAMEEIRSFGPDYTAAFAEGYATRLKARRTRAALMTALVTVPIGALAVFVF